MKSLSVLDIVAILWLLSGIIYSFYFIKVLQYKEEFRDLIRDLVWNSGYDEEFFFWVTLFISYTFGILLLPKLILRLLGIIEKRK